MKDLTNEEHYQRRLRRYQWFLGRSAQVMKLQVGLVKEAGGETVTDWKYHQRWMMQPELYCDRDADQRRMMQLRRCPGRGAVVVELVGLVSEAGGKDMY